MAVNLSRNTKAFFTLYNVDPAAAGFVAPGSEVPSSYTPANTFELTVLDGYSFSQGTEQQTITLSEAGTAPVRGERAFNSKLNPVDWSLSTYIRPYVSGGVKSAPEKYLWNALFGSNAIDTTGTALTDADRVSANSITIKTATAIFGGASISAEQVAAIGGVLTVRGATDNTAFNNSFTVSNVADASGSFLYTLVTDTDVGVTPPTITSAKAHKGQWFQDATNAVATTLGSNKNSLQKFALLFLVDNVWYKVYDAAVNQAEISFDLGGIATIAWSGFGTQLHQLTDSGWTSTALTGATSGTDPAKYLLVDSAATKYITNKLSTTTLISNISGTAGTTYSVPITGGSLTINNNIEYVTPENLGVINKSIGYFTGTRSITGSLTAYLKTGSSAESGQLLSDILAGLANTSETKFKLQVEIGGISNPTRVELLMNGAQLQVPSVDIQDVVSTTINFSAQGYTGTDYDITKTNNLTVTYYGV